MKAIQILNHTLFLLLLCFFFSCEATSAQTYKPKKKALSYFNEGKEHMNWGRIKEAEEAFKKAIDKDEDYLEAYYELGNLYEQIRHYDKAYHLYNDIAQSTMRFPLELYFRLAKMSFAIGKFQEAGLFVEQYGMIDRMSPSRKMELEQLKRNIAFAEKASKVKVAFQPKALNGNVNTENKEYFPSMTADGAELYFTRQLPDSKGMLQEDIYVSEWQGDWMPSRRLPLINTPDNEGAHSISADGRHLYFTRCEFEGGFGGCDILVAEKSGDRWGKPRLLPAPINSKMKETQPNISADGKTLFFVSDRKEGGFGHLDIWKSELQENGQWGKPENLGETINTPYSEQRPFFHPDGKTLYFSSAGHPGFGESDMFFSRLQANGQWSKPENLGFPVNSAFNEAGIYVSLNGSKGYIASDRFGERLQFNIYEFMIPEAARPEHVVYVKGKVTDEESEEGLKAKIDFYDTDIQEKVESINTDKENGKFLICLPYGANYAAKINKPGYLYHSESFPLKDAEMQNYSLEIALKALEAGNEVVLKNVFFEVDKYELLEASKTELTEFAGFLKENKSLVIEISGHTDSTGSEAHNKTLSENRAKSVYQFLIEQGIDKNRLRYKGYGSEQPIAENNTAEGRALNRRTQFKVLEVKE
ncbi:MAG: OmpA family protein [Chitinophagales bacterium]